MEKQYLQKMPSFAEGATIYQIFLRSFTLDGTLAAASNMLEHLAELGVDIVYLCPIFEADDDMHTEFWSTRQKASGFQNPKNPYRMKDYFKIDPEYGTDADLLFFVRKAHKLGLHVILDLVYLHCGPTATLVKEQPGFFLRNDDGTLKMGPWHFPVFDFSKPDVREYFFTNMEYFIRTFDVDGYRCDVADGIPLDFWEQARLRTEALKPGGIFMLAESACRNREEQKTAFDVSYGFAFYNHIVEILKGESVLQQLREDIDTRYDPEILFLRGFDNHDLANDQYEKRTERIADPRAADAACALIFAMDGMPFLYNGQEIADGRRHSLWANREHGGNLVIDWSLAATPRGCGRFALLHALIQMRHENPVLVHGSIVWIKSDKPETVLAFRREYNGRSVTAVFNFSAQPVHAVLEMESIDGTAVVLNSYGAEIHALSGKTEADLLPFGYVIAEL